MSRELIAAQSGFGKSYVSQYRVETNVENFDYLAVCDYCDEYRGLAKAEIAQWMGVGNREAALDVDGWAALLEDNERLVLARAVDAATWREDVVATIAQAARALDGDVLIVVDESHFVARMRKSTPKNVEELATTGRGQGISSIWITQRLAKLDATVSSQCDRKMLGGFTSTNDIDRIGNIVDYPAEVHNPQLSASKVPRLPDGLGDGPLQETNPGAEWIYSTRSGEYRRVDSSEFSMRSTHYGPEGSSLSIPD